MTPFNTAAGLVAPIDRPNVDTDAILPKQYLKSVRRTGFGPFLFDDWRYLDPGDILVDPSTRRPNPNFVLNQSRYRGATILLVRENFGCGSSREHAPWALQDFGVSAILAPSFADIFRGNCLKNALLPITLPDETICNLFSRVAVSEGFRLAIDLAEQSLTSSDGWNGVFQIDADEKRRLLLGLDEITTTLQSASSIRAYEDERARQEPWLFADR